MTIGWNKLHIPKPPVDIELYIVMWVYGLLLTVLNLIWNLNPYIACSIVTILWETPLLLFNDPVQWMISQC